MTNAQITGMLFVILTSCHPEVKKIANNLSADVLMVNVDSSVNPSEDFFAYANGKWIKGNPIPAEESSWGLPNLVLNENLNRLKVINENAVKSNAAQGSSTQKIADFWITAMDSIQIENVGIKPLQSYFDKINSISDIPSFLNVAAILSTIGVSALFHDMVEQDEKNSERISFHVWQGGIGLPDREYYFKSDSSTLHIKSEYVKHISRFLVLQGQDSVSASASANGILALETKLAEASKKREDLRDPDSNYNKLSLPEMKKLNEVLRWKEYLARIGISKIDSVIVGQPAFLKRLDQVIKTTAINDWKNYLRYRLLSSFEEALPEAYSTEAFNFHRVMSGAKQRKPRWREQSRRKSPRWVSC